MDGCEKSAGFNYPEAGGKADYCKDHRLEGMAPVRARQCEVRERGLCGEEGRAVR